MSANDIIWITLPTADKNVAKAKNGGNPENAAAVGRGFRVVPGLLASPRGIFAVCSLREFLNVPSIY